MKPRYGGRFNDRRRGESIQLVVTDDARKLLAERGWDPVYDAASLKRTIQRLVQDPLAMMLRERQVVLRRRGRGRRQES